MQFNYQPVQENKPSLDNKSEQYLVIDAASQLINVCATAASVCSHAQANYLCRGAGLLSCHVWNLTDPFWKPSFWIVYIIFSLKEKQELYKDFSLFQIGIGMSLLTHYSAS